MVGIEKLHDMHSKVNDTIIPRRCVCLLTFNKGFRFPDAIDYNLMPKICFMI